MGLVGMSKMLSAEEYFTNKQKVRLVNRCIPTIERKKVYTHIDYMELMEDYADYVCTYEKEQDTKK